MCLIVDREYFIHTKKSNNAITAKKSSCEIYNRVKELNAKLKAKDFLNGIKLLEDGFSKKRSNKMKLKPFLKNIKIKKKSLFFLDLHVDLNCKLFTLRMGAISI